jgi:hypothetical protein
MLRVFGLVRFAGHAHTNSRSGNHSPPFLPVMRCLVSEREMEIAEGLYPNGKNVVTESERLNLERCETSPPRKTARTGSFSRSVQAGDDSNRTAGR